MNLVMIAIAAAAAAAVPWPLPQPVLDAYPSPSPDGQSILFTSNRSGKEAIWIASRDGSAPRLLLDGGTIGKEPGVPVWAPDGKHFVFVMRPLETRREDETDIFIADADGTNVHRLTQTPGDDSHPHWSADGTRIFFNSARGTPDLSVEWGKQWHDIYSMKPTGSDVQRITHCHSVCTYPVPSPDGRWVVHRKTIDGPGFDWGLNAIQRNSEVFITSIDGRISRNLSRSPFYDGWPVWAGGGRWVVFVSNRAGPANTGQIFAISQAGRDLRQITSGGLSRVQPMPTSDSHLLFLSERVEDERGEFGRISSVPLNLPVPEGTSR